MGNKIHEKYINRCFELAQIAQGHEVFNPLVGAVIVHDDRIIGEGFYKKFGKEHAEVAAINSVLKEDLHLLPTCQMYISLEPCCIQAKTPPCVDLIIEKRIPEVYISCLDPNPLVHSKGVEKLLAAGIKVKTGILREQGLTVIKKFKINKLEKRPYVILKFAQSQDGFIGRKNERTQISNQYSHFLVHKWRGEVDAIMVGTNTAIVDNPKLTTRDFPGNSPIRICIDLKHKIPLDYYLLDKSVPTIIFTSESRENQENLTFIKINPNENCLAQIMNELLERNISSILVEGGSTLHQSFLDQDLWDEARIFTSRSTLGNGVQAVKIAQKPDKIVSIGSDNLAFYYKLS